MNAALPPSATDPRSALAGLAGMLLATAAVCRLEIAPTTAVPILMLATAIPILAVDLAVFRVHRRPSTGIDWTAPRPADLRRLATRCLGGALAVAPIALSYTFTPEYRGAFYDAWYAFLRWFGPVAAVFGVAWFAWVDRRLAEPHDGYWRLGAWLTGQAPLDREAVGQVLRTWLVKGFFTPLMFVYAVVNVRELQGILQSDRPAFLYLFDSLYSLAFLVDVVFTTVGYLVTVRLFDTQVRSAEPTLQGWVVALVCYQPFFDLVARQYIHYEDGFQWGHWLEDTPVLHYAWGAAILALLAVYSSATVVFGCRFSNLTWRGVITSGPYRWTRHPAYVSKCTSFWLIFIPFVSRGSWYEVVRDCLWLSVLCWIYWMRARTEERHLSRDPDYVAYATAMNERSIFAPLGRWFPFLAYRPPA